MSGPAYELVTRRLGEVTGYTPPRENASWRCPAHDDQNPSLTVSNGDGKVLLRCHAQQCEVAEIVAALGLTKGDLFDEPHTRPDTQARRRIVATYPYEDAGGQLLFEVVRFDPKDFRQRRPDGAGGWSWKLDDTPRVLYRLPQVLAAVAGGETIWVAEGEKDVEALERAGCVATCSPMGAGKWQQAHAAVLAGAAEVIVVQDNDAAGIKHTADVESSLLGRVGSVIVVKAATGKDAADHLGAGRSIDEFEIVSEWAPGAEPRPDGQVFDESLYPVDLAPVLAGTSLQPVPTQLARDDGNALFYPGAINGIHGDSGTGKGWIVCHLMYQNAQRGIRTMLLDFEDTAHSITARLRLLGMSDHDILTWVTYLRPQVPFDSVSVAHIIATIAELNVGAVVLDSLGEAFSLAGVNEDKDAEVGPWLRMAARPIADAGVSLNLVDHSTKAGANDLHPSGSKRKRAAITGASYLVEAVKPFVKGDGGRLRLTCAKDRHGNYRRGQAVGDLVMDSGDDTVRLTLYAPTITTSEEDVTVPIVLAARKAVAAAKDAGRPLSRNELEARMAIKGRAQIKRAGIDHAAAEGALGEERGPRNARLFTYRNDLTETQ